MIKTYFFSQKQKEQIQHGSRLLGKEYHISKINDKEFTEIKTIDGPHFSEWNDTIVVHVEDGCELDELIFKLMGTKHAK